MSNALVPVNSGMLSGKSSAIRWAAITFIATMEILKCLNTNYLTVIRLFCA
ncbi:MAG: hypothetical protein ACYTXA_25425 [Nostoc sp.]